MKLTNRHFKLNEIRNCSEVDVFVALTKHNNSSNIQEYAARLIAKTDWGNVINLYHKGEGLVINSIEEIFEQAKTEIIGKLIYEQTIRNSRELESTINRDGCN